MLRTWHWTEHISIVAGAKGWRKINTRVKTTRRNPLEVNKRVTSISRLPRSLLSQLRSGYSRNLNSYLNRIDPEICDICPKCNQSPHDTKHLFNCPNNPTNLQVSDLWTQPILAKNFLKLDEGVTWTDEWLNFWCRLSRQPENVHLGG